MHEVGLILIGMLVITYAAGTLVLVYLWAKLPPPSLAPTSFLTQVTIIVPVRNEENNISALLDDLHKQNYPAPLLEVILVDDSSSDNTAAIAESRVGGFTFSLKVIRLPPKMALQAPKKRAIETAIQVASGELILTTDGDCRVGPHWVAAFVKTYQLRRARIISGPVTFTEEKSLMDHLQTVEFSSLIGSGASAIRAGHPSMCNGANLAYDKKTFREVGGYEGNEHIASGDDEFLMAKIASRYPDDVHFLKDPKAIVRTLSHATWRAFYRQRIRWASKWKHYTNPVSIGLAVFVFSANVALIAALAGGVSGLFSWGEVVIIFLIKWIPEWLFIGLILVFLKKKRSLAYIPLVQLVYPFYVTLFGIAGQKPSYHWKGRILE